MAKEKFVRSKPHVNFFEGLKQKLFGAPPEEPPVEPLDDSSQGEGAAASTQEPWLQSSSPDVEGRTPAHTPDFTNPLPGTPGPQPGVSPSPSGGANELTGENVPGTRMHESDVALTQEQAHLSFEPAAEDTSDDPALAHESAGEGSRGPPAPAGEISTQSPRAGSDAGIQEGGLNASMHKLPGSDGDQGQAQDQSDLDFLQQRAQRGGDGEPDQPLIVGSVPNQGSADFIPERDDEVSGVIEGDTRQPYILGNLYNGEDAGSDLGDDGPSTLADLDEQEEPAPMNDLAVVEPGDVELEPDTGLDLDDQA